MRATLQQIKNWQKLLFSRRTDFLQKIRGTFNIMSHIYHEFMFENGTFAKPLSCTNILHNASRGIYLYFVHLLCILKYHIKYFHGPRRNPCRTRKIGISISVVRWIISSDISKSYFAFHFIIFILKGHGDVTTNLSFYQVKPWY